MRRLSGAAGAAAVQCGVDITLSFSPEVLLVHKSKRGDPIPIPQAELKAVLAGFHRHYHPSSEPLDASH